jgi:hypothetical protein
MRYAVFGPSFVQDKLYDRYDHVAASLSLLPNVEELVLGGGKGVETLADTWAKENNIPVHHIPPLNRDWRNRIGQEQVFILRNNKIIERMDAMVLFWDGYFAEHLHLQMSAINKRKMCVVFPL